MVDSGGGVGGASSTSSSTSSSASTGSAGAGGACEVPTSEISSLEAVALARCVIPDGEQARLLGYATNGHSIAPGKNDYWALMFQDDEATYNAAAGIDVLGYTVSALPQPDCTPSSVPALDTTEVFPVALTALQAGDAPLDLFLYRHSPSCLDWGADGYAVVATDWSLDDEGPVDFAVFSPLGELVLVCGPCDFGWVECCGPL